MTMELDSDPTIFLISESVYHEIFPAESTPQLKASQAQLKGPQLSHEYRLDYRISGISAYK